MSQLPDIATIAKEIAKGLKNIKVVVVCDICQERWEAVMMEAPRIGLSAIGHSEDPLDFAKLFYTDAFKKGHPEHPVLIGAIYTSEVAHYPIIVPYQPLSVSEYLPRLPT